MLRDMLLLGQMKTNFLVKNILRIQGQKSVYTKIIQQHHRIIRIHNNPRISSGMTMSLIHLCIILIFPINGKTKTNKLTWQIMVSHSEESIQHPISNIFDVFREAGRELWLLCFVPIEQNGRTKYTISSTYLPQSKTSKGTDGHSLQNPNAFRAILLVNGNDGVAFGPFSPISWASL